MVEIPLIAYPSQQFSCVLGDQNCTVNLYMRGDYPYLDLYVGKTLIRQGAICMPLTRIIQKPADFKGQLYLVDSTSPKNDQSVATYDELGTRYRLVYRTAEEEGEE